MEHGNGSQSESDITRTSRAEAVDKVCSAIRAVWGFLQHHLLLANSHGAEFISQGHWNKFVPQETQKQLLSLSTEDLINLPQHGSNMMLSSDDTGSGHSKDWLQNFIEKAHSCHLEQLGILSILSDVVKTSDVECPDLEANRSFGIISDSMKEKKLHEVEIMCKAVVRLFRSCKADIVVDIGSGKGYLSCELARHYNVPVLGLDSRDTNTCSALLRDGKLGQRWTGLSKKKQKLKHKNESLDSFNQTYHQGKCRQSAKINRVLTLPEATNCVEDNSDVEAERNQDSVFEHARRKAKSVSVSAGNRGGKLLSSPSKLNPSDLISDPGEGGLPCCKIHRKQALIIAASSGCHNNCTAGILSTPYLSSDVCDKSNAHITENISEPQTSQTNVYYDTIGGSMMELYTEENQNLLSKLDLCRDRISIETSVLPSTPRMDLYKNTCLDEKNQNILSTEIKQDIAKEVHRKSMVNHHHLHRNVPANETIDRLSSHRAKDGSGDKTLDLKCPTAFYVPLTLFVHPNMDLRQIVQESASQLCSTEKSSTTSNLLLTGLHTCGSLAVTVMKLFLQDPGAVGLCYVGCCYQLMEEACSAETSFEGGELVDYHFPLSQFGKELKLHLGRNARNLAAQSILRIKASGQLQGKDFYWRALLDVLLRELKVPVPDKITGMRGLNKKSKTLKEYAMRALKNLNLSTQLVTEKLLEDIEKKHRDNQDKMTAFFQLKLILAPVIESLILLDRYLFLLEQEYVEWAHIVQVFDPVTSPRCYALLVKKAGSFQ